MNRFLLFFIRIVLNVLPEISTPRFNVFLFTLFKNKTFKIHKSARIFSSVKIFGKIKVSIGANTYIGHQSIITGGANAFIKIGSDCDISDRVSVFCGTHEVDGSQLKAAGRGIGKDITIGNGVWIGYGALILPGVNISDNVIVAAGCVVHKNIPSHTIVGGNPMKIIRKINE